MAASTVQAWLSFVVSFLALLVSVFAWITSRQADNRTRSARIIPSLTINTDAGTGVLVLTNAGFETAYAVDAYFEPGHSSWVQITGPSGEADAIPEFAVPELLPLSSLPGSVSYQVPLTFSELLAEQVIVVVTWCRKRDEKPESVQLPVTTR